MGCTSFRVSCNGGVWGKTAMAAPQTSIARLQGMARLHGNMLTRQHGGADGEWAVAAKTFLDVSMAHSGHH